MLQIPNVTELEGQSEDEGAAVTRATEDTPSGENGTFALSLSDLENPSGFLKQRSQFFNLIICKLLTPAQPHFTV